MSRQRKEKLQAAKANLYRSLMIPARLRVERMDEVDGGAELRLPLDIRLRTVMTAIQSGMNNADWSTVADAMVMLQQIELRYRPADSKSPGFFLQE